MPIHILKSGALLVVDDELMAIQKLIQFIIQFFRLDQWLCGFLRHRHDFGH